MVRNAMIGLLIRFGAMGVVLSASLCLTWGMGFPQGLIKAKQHPTIVLPETGLAWLVGEDHEGVCEDVPIKEWIRKPSDPYELLVHAEGPSGSGRYWILTIGLTSRHGAAPERGVCLQTSTLGWRTLQRFKDLPLPWADDLDEDGKAELMIWDSFPLTADESMAEFGLMAWIYRVQRDATFMIDWNLSRRMARELAAAYQLPLQPDREKLQKVRNLIAQELEKFAMEKKGETSPGWREGREDTMGREKLPGSREELLTLGYIDIETAQSVLHLKEGQRFFYTYPKWGSVGIGAKYEIEDRTVIEFVGDVLSYDYPQRIKAGMTGADEGTGTFIFKAVKKGKSKLTIQKDFRGEKGEELKSLELLVE